jgi:hypothetical protein
MPVSATRLDLMDRKLAILTWMLGGLLLTAPASAQTVRCDTFGDVTRCTGPGGYSSVERASGDITNGSDSRGNTWRTSRFGDTSTTTAHFADDEQGVG